MTENPSSSFLLSCPQMWIHQGSLKEQQVPEDLEKDEGKGMLCILRGRLLFSSEEPKNVRSL